MNPNRTDSIADIPGLPYSTEAEQAALGCAILDADCLGIVIEKLTEESFYIPLHRRIFAVLKAGFDAGKRRMDFIMVMNELGSSVDMASEELKSYLLRICQIVPTMSNLNSYVRIIVDKYYMRSLYAASKDTIDAISEGVDGADSILERAEQRIYDIRQGKGESGFVGLPTALDEVQKETKELFRLKRQLRGIPCGFSELDRMLSGLNDSDMIVLAARPGVGKSAFAINIACSVAGRKVGTVCMFTLEMSRLQMVQRMIASEGNIDLTKLLTGALGEDEWSRFGLAVAKLSDSSILIDDTAALTISEMKSRLRRVRGLKLVIIDYLQLISSGSSRYGDNRTAEVSEMTRSLKIMAKELGVPVIVLSQLSRNTEKRAKNDHVPKLSDLRESGSIEQDADSVLFLYKPYAYDNAEDPSKVMCVVAKNRHGPTSQDGGIQLHWQGNYTKFSSTQLDEQSDESNADGSTPF